MHINPKNPLLVRDELGKAKPSTRDLPPDDHKYGLEYKPRLEGTKEIIHKPAIHEKPTLPPTDKNFAKINVEAQGKKFAKRGEYIEFTKSKDIRVKRKIGRSEIENVLPEENFVYGVPNRPSTPMNEVMSKVMRKLVW